MQPFWPKGTVFRFLIEPRSRSEVKMRKFLWIILALFMFAAIVAPSVRADTVTFTCTGESGGGPCLVAVPTAPDVTFPGPTLDITWAGQTFDITLPSDWADTDSYFWGASNDFFGIGDNNHEFDLEPFATINTTLPGIGGVSEGGIITFT